MELNLRVVHNDDRVVDTTAVFADFVAFERTWNRSVIQFEREARLTDMAWLAWKSLVRTQKIDMPFDPQWLDTVKMIEVTKDEEESPFDSTGEAQSGA